MFLLDTNVLVHAANADSPSHLTARNFLQTTRSSTAPWALAWSILYEFWRVVTHPRVLSTPLSRVQVRAFVRALIASGSLEILAETDRHASFFEKVLDELREPAANLAHDAHLVALMREHGISEICTLDTDFHRFSGIRVIDPLRSK